MPVPRDLPQKRSPPPSKNWNAKALKWEQIFGAIPRGCAGGWLRQKLIAALTQLTSSIFWVQLKYSATSSLHCSTIPLFYWIGGR